MPRGSKRRIDLIGKTFGRLTVLYEDGMCGSKVMWMCSCSCGNQKCVKSSALIHKTRPTTSCGCLNREVTIQQNKARKGIPQGRRKDQDEVGRNLMRLSYKAGAKKRGYAWELSKERFFELTKQDCFWCLDPPTPRQKQASKNELIHRYLANGIDRYDNTIGYTVENSIPCCWTCNRMKMAMGAEEFLAHVRKIADANKVRNSSVSQ